MKLMKINNTLNNVIISLLFDNEVGKILFNLLNNDACGGKIIENMRKRIKDAFFILLIKVRINIIGFNKIFLDRVKSINYFRYF